MSLCCVLLAIFACYQGIADACYGQDEERVARIWLYFLPQESHKISQLQLASHLGLQVPRTSVSNDPDGVRPFYEACHRQIIYKTLGVPMRRFL